MKKYLIILSEFGLMWGIYRILYSMKLSILRKIPKLDFIFEKKVEIKNINLFNFDVEVIEEFLSDLPIEEKNKIINSANNALIGKIKGFSSIELDYGYPINWHVSPITGKGHSKEKKWFDIPDFDRNVGDIKVIWEISRLTHFIDFSRAYMITKDIKYFDGYMEQIRNWVQENKYSYGPNYKCGQEATIRMVNVLIAYSIFNQYNLVSNEDEKLIKKLVKYSYKKIHSNFFYAHKCIKNNHTFTEVLGKIIGAWAEGDEKRVKKSMKLMENEIETQITNDGGFSQYSNNYHRFILQILEILLKIEPQLSYKLSNKDKIFKSNLVLFNMMNDEGFVPNYGSNDGALIFPLSNSDFRDYRPTVGAIHALLENEELFDSGIHSEEILWFSGKIKKRSKLKKLPFKMQDIGQYSFRYEDSFLLLHLNNLKYRPAHMDQLHLDFWHKNEEIFADLGTYSYASELGYELSLNTNHNTVSVPGRLQMNKTGPFMTYNRTTIKDVSYDINKRFIGTMVSKNGYIHTREVIKTDNGFKIIDDVNQETYSIVFNTPLEVKVDNYQVLLIKNHKVIVKLLTKERITIKQKYRSLYYYKKLPINQIKIDVQRKGKTKTEVVLVGEEND